MAESLKYLINLRQFTFYTIMLHSLIILNVAMSIKNLPFICKISIWFTQTNITQDDMTLFSQNVKKSKQYQELIIDFKTYSFQKNFLFITSYSTQS